jgi:hypothetical protein
MICLSTSVCALILSPMGQLDHCFDSVRLFEFLSSMPFWEQTYISVGVCILSQITSYNSSRVDINELPEVQNFMFSYFWFWCSTQCTNLSICLSIYLSIYTHIYIYIYKWMYVCLWVCMLQHNSGTPGAISTKLGTHMTLSLSLYIYIYICRYIVLHTVLILLYTCK